MEPNIKIEKTGELWNPDFMKFAESMGLEGIRVEDPNKIKPTFEQATKKENPLIIDVSINLEVKQYSVYPFSYPKVFGMRGLDEPLF